MINSLSLVAKSHRTEATPEFHCAAGPPLRQNLLLAALSGDELGRLSGELSLVSLQPGQVICESGCKQQYSYFPTSALASLFNETADGATIEVAEVGNEGLAGIGVVLVGEASAHRLVVESGGEALRIHAAALRSEFHRGGAVQRLLLRYAQSWITQIAQAAACSRHHCVRERLCRRLLSSLDRANSNEIHLTHDTIAHMLGVRRESISFEAGRLHHAGVIDYRRGTIHIIDRTRLESQACECYRILKSELARLAPTAH